MLGRAHPDGLITPPPMAIAHQLMRGWVDGGSGRLNGCTKTTGDPMSSRAERVSRRVAMRFGPRDKSAERG